jgi:CubicO group peptidase (beta-lactamase class C family)
MGEALPEGFSGTLAAARGGELVHCEGFGLADREAGASASCDTVYDLMSMTKQFTAAAILKLEMMRKLRVNDSIAAHLEGVPRDKREITIAQLLTHSSGLIDALGGDYEPLARDEMLAGAFASRLESRPGTTYAYSNLGYGVLAALVEEVSGLSYEEFLSEQLFEPSGMDSTGYVLPDWDSAQVAIEYDASGEAQGRPFDHPWADDGPYWNLRGNGGILSTPRDAYRWHVALEGDEILDDEAKVKLFRPWLREEAGGDSFSGFGWVVQDTEFGRIAWHDGGNGWSFGIVTRALDDGSMVFWITNQWKNEDLGWSAQDFAEELTAGVLGQLQDA